MRTAAQVIGTDAEELVARRLRHLGWTILGRNVHVGRAEIDILAVDPSSPATLVAVEVRWRARRDFGLPEETVDRAKVARLRAAALTLREGTPPAGRQGAGRQGTGRPLVGRPLVGRQLVGVPIPRLPVRVDIVALESGGRIRHHRYVA